MGGASAGGKAFSGVLKRGLHDAGTEYLRGGMRDLGPFRQAFKEAQERGVSPTALASSGEYFGGKKQPIEVNVYHDGRVTLSDGRHRYTSAREAGAEKILAKVTQYGPRGGVVSTKTTVIKIR